MSGDQRSPEQRALDALVGEAKEHLDVAPNDLDWSRLEAKLMAAVEAEPAPDARAEQDRRRRRRDVLLRAGALAFASAAAALVYVRQERVRSRESVVVVDPKAGHEAVAVQGAAAISASSLRSTEGTGLVRVAEREVAVGHVLHPGDVLDVSGARAVFERDTRVMWLLEGRDGHDGHAPTAHASVKAAGESLVLGLDDGAIEAQVTPVPQGEAFAVDIATEHNLVRVAVHGTHLRVARLGDRVSVDLTEGVVSIGIPPRVGMTFGTLVTAPAHVELDATDLTTIRVEHDAGSVRAAIPLGPHQATSAAPSETHAPIAAAPPIVAANKAVHPAAKRELGQRGRQEGPETPAREVIAVAVRECAAARSRSGDVHVTVTSNLNLKVAATGEVLSAQFSPPLLPEIQTCAAQVIYKTKLDETGMVTVPIEFSY